MFKNYEIKKINNEEVLFLYLDLTNEFGSFKKEKKTTINNEISSYLNKNRINFNGRKIILMASTILVGACLLNSKPQVKDELNYIYTPSSITLKENINLDKDIENIVNSITPEKNITNKPSISTTNPDSKKVETKKQVTTSTPPKKNTPTTTAPKPPEKVEVPKQTTPKKEESKPSTPVTENSSYLNPITIKRKSGKMETLELEEYIIGVVAAEMPASFHIEALKAQAIAARTYALKTIASGKTLTDDVSTQVYQDNKELQAKWGSSYSTYYNKIKTAVNSTAGLLMYYNNTLINAYYHSTSNGSTEDSAAVFGEYPYLKSVDSSVDKNVASYLKTTALSYETISNKLGIPITSLSTIQIVKNNSGRVDKIIIDNHIYGGIEFRTKLGLRSTDFTLTLNTNNISITTKGYGHGVGMSQYGAHEYAKKGWTYTQILKHYYTGITIKKG